MYTVLYYLRLYYVYCPEIDFAIIGAFNTCRVDLRYTLLLRRIVSVKTEH